MASNSTKRPRSDSDASGGGSEGSDEGLIPSGVLPSYVSDAFGELFEQDGLAVMGKGMGSLELLSTLCRFYADVENGYRSVQLEEEEAKKKKPGASETDNSQRMKRQQPPLVLVLGLNEKERTALMENLISWGTPAAVLPTVVTNEAGQKEDRQSMYRRGGIFLVTSRILIVDLLTKVADPNIMDGILVYHADRVTEESTIAFIIRIFVSQKQPTDSGFVKAITDAPEALLSGFGKVDKILKSLHVRNLYLYPRFHDDVRNELEEKPPQITELRQELSPLQQQMQHALAAAVTACLRELKEKTGSLVDWGDLNNQTNEQQQQQQQPGERASEFAAATKTAVSVENCVTGSFDRTISRQLEPYWHRLAPSVKQLVQDLRTLRTLFQSLIVYDSITFWKLLASIRTMSAASRHASLWLLTPAADVLYRKAKQRVYTVHHPSTDTNNNDDPQPQVGKLYAVLESNPKWKLLRKILEEIKDKDAKEQEEAGNDDTGPRFVLVLVKDSKTLKTLESYMLNGNDMLNFRWLNYLEQVNDRSRSLTNTKGTMAAISEESRLLLEEESRVRHLMLGDDARKERKAKNSATRRILNQVPQHIRKRRRVAAEQGRGQTKGAAEDLEREAVLEDAVQIAEHDFINNGDNEDDRKRPASLGEDEHYRVSNPSELRIVIRSYASIEGGNALQLLQDMAPRHILLYDTDVGFIRSVEIYQSLSQSPIPVQVYFFIFEASAEEKNFVKSMEREQSAFERLIHHKKTMPPPALRIAGATQEMQMAQGASHSYMHGSLPLAFDTRTGRGKIDRSKERRDIAVDVREFRSALPSILHQGGMRLAPVTLTVGDFVLSNVHCVERKSISDLFGSFASGRLYTQAESMSKYYKCPCLLIEFDPNKSFCLQNASELGFEIRNDSVCSKMSLLCIHFPKLRILWARSPHETLRIFRELKTNHEEVDVERAMDVGRDESLDSLLQQQNQGEEEEDEINEAARDMLLRLPGVNARSARCIMNEVDSLAELSELSREDLRRIAGPVTGQKLFTFFRQRLASS